MIPLHSDKPSAGRGTTTQQPDLSIVVPARNEEQNLPVLFHEIREACEAAGASFELIAVDDGSQDGTAETIRGLAKAHPNVRGLLLTRHFGHQAAVSLGLLHVRGRAVAIMDADLQDRPQDLVAMYRRWQKGADVVYAVRRSRHENLFKRAAYRAFYRVLAKVADIPIPLDSGDFCVMDAKFVGRLNELPEHLRFVRGLRAWLGGSQVALPVQRSARREGKSQYSAIMLTRLALDGLVSFSNAPLRVASLVGLVVSACAFLGVLVVLTWKIRGMLPTGFAVATTALSVLFLGGIQLLTIGILGEYIGRIFLEIKGRPVGVVAEIVGDEPRADGPRARAQRARDDSRDAGSERRRQDAE